MAKTGASPPEHAAEPIAVTKPQQAEGNCQSGLLPNCVT